MIKTSGALREASYKEKINHTIEEELSRIYLNTTSKSGKQSKKKKPSFRSKIPWIIAAAALIAALAAFLFSSNIDIKIRVAGGAAFIDKESPINTIPEKSVFIVEGGKPNKTLVKRAVFFGDARPLSYAFDEYVTLSNYNKQGWADYKIELNRPVNLSGLNMRYTAKGDVGGERLVLMLIDADNRVVRIENDIATKLDKDWNVYTINFAPLKHLADLTEIVAIKFEFGSMTAGSSPRAVMYLKDIMVIKNRRLKWL